MAVKAIVVDKSEMKEVVENVFKQEGKNVVSVEITFNEQTEKEVAVINVDGKKVEREVESFIPQLNELHSIDIHTFDGFDYPEFAGQAGGFVFLF